MGQGGLPATALVSLLLHRVSGTILIEAWGREKERKGEKKEREKN